MAELPDSSLGRLLKQIVPPAAKVTAVLGYLVLLFQPSKEYGRILFCITVLSVTVWYAFKTRKIASWVFLCVAVVGFGVELVRVWPYSLPNPQFIIENKTQDQIVIDPSVGFEVHAPLASGTQVVKGRISLNLDSIQGEALIVPPGATVNVGGEFLKSSDYRKVFASGGGEIWFIWRSRSRNLMPVGPHPFNKKWFNTHSIRLVISDKPVSE